MRLLLKKFPRCSGRPLIYRQTVASTRQSLLPIKLSRDPLRTLWLIELHQRTEVDRALRTAARTSNTDTVRLSFSRIAAHTLSHRADALDTEAAKRTVSSPLALGCCNETLVLVCVKADAVTIRVARTGAAGTAYADVALAVVCAVRVAGWVKWAASTHAVEADKTVATSVAAAATVL